MKLKCNYNCSCLNYQNMVACSALQLVIGILMYLACSTPIAGLAVGIYCDGLMNNDRLNCSRARRLFNRNSTNTNYNGYHTQSPRQHIL